MLEPAEILSHQGAVEHLIYKTEQMLVDEILCKRQWVQIENRRIRIADGLMPGASHRSVHMDPASFCRGALVNNGELQVNSWFLACLQIPQPLHEVDKCCRYLLCDRRAWQSRLHAWVLFQLHCELSTNHDQEWWLR